MRTLALAVAALAVCGCVVVTNDHCTDGLLDADESDVDCGGANCALCGLGRACFGGGDCLSGLCINGFCGTTAGATCNDGILNQGEVDVDCGGPCAACAPGHLGGAGGDVPVGATVYHIDPGASVIVTPGTQAGFAVTANVGGSFRLVWTGDAAASGDYHEFWGSVYSSGGFSNVVPGCANGSCSLEAGDFVGNPV